VWMVLLYFNVDDFHALSLHLKVDSFSAQGG